MLTKKKQIKQKKLRHNEYYNMTDMLDNLYKKGLEGENFKNLMDIISSEENIKLAYRNIKSNEGSVTAGVDGLTIKDIEKLPTEEYVKGIRNRLANYNPKAVKRVEIPKPNGGTRPLGIPCIWDRLIQQCILQVLEPIVEAKFYDKSNGFRPHRSPETAIAQTMKLMQQQNMKYVVDIDIKGFFDNVNHCKLRKQMWSMGIRDKKLLCIVDEMLKAKIRLPNGDLITPEKGTPQGGILSPLLSNIVLNELDWWIASQWENIPTKHEYAGYKHKTGTVGKGHKYAALRSNTKLKEVFIVRYADDFQIYCKNYKDAINIFEATKKWLKERLNLEVNTEKSKIVNLTKEKAEFLGFTFKLKERGNSHKVVSHMSDKSIKRVKTELKNVVKKIQHTGGAKETYILINQYNSKVIGIHNYYRIATMITDDCSIIQRNIEGVFRNRLRKRYKKNGELENGYIKDNYGKSKQMRYINNQPLIPIGYTRTKNAMHKKAKVNKYTPEGRSEIHKSLGVNMKILHKMMNQKLPNRSIEYMDNRISLYAAQKGKCAVTGEVLDIDNIHCHHKTPVYMGGNDKYRNLIIVSIIVHRLIHATQQDTINKYIADIKPNDKMLIKINELRLKAGNDIIIM